MQKILVFSFLLLIISCGNSETTEFSISIDYIDKAVANQVITVNVSPSNNHKIQNTDLILDTDLNVKLIKNSEREYQIVVSELYFPQSLRFQVTAYNDGAIATSNGSITYSLNTMPIVSILNRPSFSYAAEEDSLIIDLGATDLDNHHITDYKIESNQAGVMINRLTDTRFSIDLPDVDHTQNISFIAYATDEFLQAGYEYFSIRVKDSELAYIDGLGGVLSNSKESYHIYDDDLPENISITDVNWQQKSGPLVIIESPNEKRTNITFPLTYGSEKIKISSIVSLSNGETITLTKTILTIKNLDVVPQFISNSTVQDIYDKRTKLEGELDINQDGLADLVTVELGVVYVQYQLSNNVYLDREKLAELSFHQLLSEPSNSYNLDALQDNTEVIVSELKDMNNDGLLDIVVQGRLVFSDELYSINIAGWIKSIAIGKYQGDFIALGNEVSSFEIEDINLDGYPDLLQYDNLVFFSGPSIRLGGEKGFSRDITFHEPIQFPNQTLSSVSDFRDLLGDGNKDLLSLVSKNHYWDLDWDGVGESWIKIHTLDKTTKLFNQAKSIYLGTQATNVMLIDVTADGIDDIVYYEEASKNYMYIDMMQVH